MLSAHPSRPPEHALNPLRLSLGVTILTAILFVAYEAAKQLLYPQLTIWQSHSMTVVFAATLAATGSYYAFGKLRKEEERYRSLFVRMLDGIYRSTHEGRFLDVNPAFVKMFGYSSRQEMLDIPDISKALYFSPEERGRHIPETAQNGVEAFPMRRKDGSEIWVEDRGGYVHDKKGNVVYHEGILRDITERRKLEAELEKHVKHLEELVEARTKELWSAREELEHVLATNPATVFLSKPLPDLSDWISTFVSKSATTVFGFDAGIFLHEQGSAFWQSHVHPQDLARYKEEIPALWQDGQHAFEFRFLHVDGTYHWIREEQKVTRDSEGRIVDVVGVAIDISERKKLEEELLKTQRLAAIGETAAMVGHDLRNPLQAMTGTVYVVKKLIESPKVEEKKEAAELLNTLDEQVGYMEKIVSDLQNYSGPVAVEPIELDLTNLMNDILTNARLPENIETKVTASEETARVTVDPVLMRRILVNLVTNAVQAMPEGGTLTVTASKRSNLLAVAVQDSGVGIQPENLEKIFTPFFTRKAKGQGLGLAVCKRLVEAQGGMITVKSDPGHGSTLTFTVPTKRGSDASYNKEPVNRKSH